MTKDTTARILLVILIGLVTFGLVVPGVTKYQKHRQEVRERKAQFRECV